jgi:AcrR family transcriptional regulator
MNRSAGDDALTLEDAAKLCGMTVASLRGRIRRGTLASITDDDGETLVSESELRRSGLLAEPNRGGSRSSKRDDDHQSDATAADDSGLAELRSEIERLKAEVSRLSSEEAPEPRRRRMSAEDRRTLIVDRALPEFASYGVNGVTADALAHAVGVSQPYLIRLFGSKKELYLAVVNRSFELLEQEIDATVADLPESPRERLDAITKAHRKLLRASKVRLGEMQLYASCGDPDIRAVVRDRWAKLYQHTQEITGASDEEMVEFVSRQVLAAVTAALDLESIKDSEPWAQNLLAAAYDD